LILVGLENGSLTNVMGDEISFNWIKWSWCAEFNCPITSKYDPCIRITPSSVFLK
jgi:hypothetical protein